MCKNQKNKYIGVDVTKEQLLACAVSEKGEMLYYVGIENDDDDLQSAIIELVGILLEDSGIKAGEIMHIGVGSVNESVPKDIKQGIEDALNIPCHIADKNQL